jgi:hypothetical protein
VSISNVISNHPLALILPCLCTVLLDPEYTAAQPANIFYTGQVSKATDSSQSTGAAVASKSNTTSVSPGTLTTASPNPTPSTASTAIFTKSTTTYNTPRVSPTTSSRPTISASPTLASTTSSPPADSLETATTNNNTLTIIRNFGILLECQGDCDDDGDCDWGLSCLQRDGSEAVPECTGKAHKSYDYCYKPGPGRLVQLGSGGSPAERYPLQDCQGDCQTDNDCEYGLVCMQRNGYEIVPGCEGRGRSGLDYCYRPIKGSLVLQGYQGWPVTSYPLKKCEGDCREDGECKGELRCFLRKYTEHVPGCMGLGQPGFGYCYDHADVV